MTEISEILAKLDPKTRQRVQAAVEVETLKQKTPSIGLNLALKGGFGHGRQILVWGNKSAGKSSFCLQMIAEAQKEGKTCAWIDAEHSYSQEWAEKLGVNSDELIYSPAKTINDMVDVAQQLMEAGVDIIICGQTAGARGLNKTNVNTNVKFALSAMTALLQYQNNGYRFMKF